MHTNYLIVLVICLLAYLPHQYKRLDPSITYCSILTNHVIFSITTSFITWVLYKSKPSDIYNIYEVLTINFLIISFIDVIIVGILFNMFRYTKGILILPIVTTILYFIVYFYTSNFIMNF